MSRAAGPVSAFIDRHFRHFNAAALTDAADGYSRHVDAGGHMLVTLGGAMSTAELGISLAEMIRAGKVHAICCTGANLEEDVFNLVAHSHYERVPHYRDLTPRDEQALLERHLNRVTDTCIPEEEAMRRIERLVLEEWLAADGRQSAPSRTSSCIGCCARRCSSRSTRSIRATAGCSRPATPTCRSSCPAGRIRRSATCSRRTASAAASSRCTRCKSGIEYMMALARVVPDDCRRPRSIGFFQIGGGIAGDFPICVVPMLHQDLRLPDVPLWGYFCQISDSTTSYGSYSGAVPNEKITWGKLGADTPKFIIESDATIVAPLMFAKVLGW